MLKIRLQRIGRRNDPSFRVVVTEHTRGPNSEKHVDRVGFYNPKTKEQSIDGDKIKEWIAKGAQASDTVHNMLIKAGIIEGKTINVLPQKSPVVSEKAAEPEAAAASDETPADEAPTEVAEETATEEVPAEAETTEEKAAEETPVEEAPVTQEAPKEEKKTGA